MPYQSEDKAARNQLIRFCLYGFLKNLQFFDPFLVLAFRDKGLSFTQIGVLISFRAVFVNLFEVPSGAIADTWGRRRSLIFSMAAYIASFLLFAAAGSYPAFFPAMLLFALGESFRTGTHKAMIFQWLNRHRMQKEKSRIYGLTRSWSKQGSAINSLIAAAIMITSRRYEFVFLLAVPPYLLNIINLLLYPDYLDENTGNTKSLRESLRILKSGIKLTFTRLPLACLVMEDAFFEGVYSVVKEYIQPMLKAMALALPVLLAYSGQTRIALVVATTYFILHQINSLASRLSHRASTAAGGETALGAMLWIFTGLLYAIMLASLVYGSVYPAITAFVILSAVLNMWKPAFVSRFHDQADEESAATALSTANQTKSLVIALLAPLLGRTVDFIQNNYSGPNEIYKFWPAALLGIAAAAAGFIANRISAKHNNSRL